MTDGLSKRERFLIILAILVVIVFVGRRYVFIPFYENYTAKLNEYSRLVREKAAVEEMLGSEDVIISNNEAAHAEFNEISNRFPSDISSYEADLMLTMLCQLSGFTPVSLGMSEPKPYEIVIETPSGGATGDAGTENEKEKEPYQSAFSVMSASMNLSGGYDSLKELIDKTEESEFLRLGKLSYTVFEETNRAGSPNVSVTFDITMLNKDRLKLNGQGEGEGDI